MRLWVQKEFAIASWHADVTVLTKRPQALVALVRAIYGVAAETKPTKKPATFGMGAALSRRARREEFRSLDQLQVRTRCQQRVGNDAVGVA